MTAPSPKPPIWLLVLITVSGTLAMHMFVPALPIAARDLGAGTAAMQTTISVYILGLAGGQLLYGPMSDAFGRRPLLLLGLSVYTVASIAAALAPDVHTLVLARLFQIVLRHVLLHHLLCARGAVIYARGLYRPGIKLVNG